MNFFSQMLSDLRTLQSICRELLTLAERESQSLRSGQTESMGEASQARKGLLPQLNDTLAKVRQHSVLWQNLTVA